MNILREITPLTPYDCFTIFSREKREFNFPLHTHEDIEMNLILDGGGAQRIVGDHIQEISDRELVFIGSNLAHGWFTNKCACKNTREITIQFHPDLFDEKFLRRNQMIDIRNMLENARCGILFHPDTADNMATRITALYKKGGFDSIIELLSILHDLSISKDTKVLSNSTFSSNQDSFGDNRIGKVIEYMTNNFSRHISLSEVSEIANMSEASFSRFIKKHTGISFIDNLNEIRLGHVTRMLIDTSFSISEIAFKSGFNNMANFNRTFKSKKGLTPSEFRSKLLGERIFI
jgi:AraC-like DNA-binding protein